MDTLSLIKRIEDYSEATGLAPSTVCVRATGNSRLYGRLKRQATLTRDYAERLLRHMAANPPTDAPPP